MTIKADWLDVAKVLETGGLASHDARQCRELLVRAHDNWFNADQNTFEILEIERAYTSDVRAVKPFKFVVDLYVRVLEPTPPMKKAGIDRGALGLIDWKTSGYNFSTYYGRDKFDTYYRQSKQAHNYLGASVYASLDAEFIIFRGISKDPLGGVHQLMVKRGVRCWSDLKDDIDNSTALVESLLKTRPLGPWFKNAPEACSKWGVQCPYYGDCQVKGEDLALPVVVPPHLSFSSIQTLSSCPERWRRDRLEYEDKILDEGSDASRLGSAFHLGMAALYTQLKKGAA
jgi:hypothetical protein